MLYKISFKHTVLGLVLFSIALVAALPVYAITQGYLSDDKSLQPGMAVQLSGKSDADNPKVERATIEKGDRIIGVATTARESSVMIASAEQSVYVETSGEVDAYVSDINGEVKNGDLLTASPLNGVLAKYVPGSASIFGLAVEDVEATKPRETYTIQTPEGEKTTSVAKIKVNLDQKGIGGSSKGASPLEKLGQSVTGKQVSEVRVVVALIIFTMILIAEGAILYGSMSSAVTSIGRNPLASKAIKRELLKVMAVAVLVMMVGLGAIYLVLWV